MTTRPDNPDLSFQLIVTDSQFLFAVGTEQDVHLDRRPRESLLRGTGRLVRRWRRRRHGEPRILIIHTLRQLDVPAAIKYKKIVVIRWRVKRLRLLQRYRLHYARNLATYPLLSPYRGRYGSGT